MDRRSFLRVAAGGLASAGTLHLSHARPVDTAPRFFTANSRWQAAYDKALDVLNSNVQVMPYISKPVLIEGAVYRGIWQECGPHEALVYRKFRPDVARNSHTTFFELQRADGQLPANNKVSETGFGQIQMVVPIAATAWELARATGDGALLESAYRACSAWDGWLMRYRNTRGTGLIEGFCTYDTGHDNSPRWAGMPNQCPNKDARTHHPIATLPRLCPDLSATVYGGRRALAQMAQALGKVGEAGRWSEMASHIRDLIVSKLYVSQDAAFYDLDAKGDFIRVRSDIISRVCGEHVPDQALFDTLWTRQLHNPKAFWAPYPLTSVAMDDPTFVGSIPANSWGGATQALTALRAGRWFDHYGRSAEFTQMMDRWCAALMADMTFRQQMHPRTGAFTHVEAADYSPAALVMIDYSWRLVGVCEDADALHWNVRPNHGAAKGTHLSMQTDAGRGVAMAYRDDGADLSLGGAVIGRISGGAARLVTDKQGRPSHLLGIEAQRQKISVELAGRPGRVLSLRANQTVAL